MSRIGILGGMGPAATQFFLAELLETYRQDQNPVADQDYPDITILMECTMPDRTQELEANGHQASTRINNALKQLHDSGCGLLCIPCVSAHALVDPAWFERGLFDIRRSIIASTARHHGQTLGIMATDGALLSDVLQPLSDYFNLVTPSEPEQARLMSMVYGPTGIKSGSTDTDKCLADLRHIIEHLNSKGAELLLPGCTEIEMFISQMAIDGQFAFPMGSLCRDLVRAVVKNDWKRQADQG